MPANRTKTSFFQADYPAPRNYVLVLSCVDARLLDELVEFLDGDNLGNRYYHITLPGAALGLTDYVHKDIEARQCKPKNAKDSVDDEGPCRCGQVAPDSDEKLKAQFKRWRETFIDQVRAAVILTKGTISDIYIVQHEDCGAFRVYLEKDGSQMSQEEELHMHRNYAQALLEDLTENFCDIYNVRDCDGRYIQEKKPFVRTFFKNLRGCVTHLQSYPLIDAREKCESPPAQVATTTRRKRTGKK